MTDYNYEQPKQRSDNVSRSERYLVARGLVTSARVVRHILPPVSYPAPEPVINMPLGDPNPFLATEAAKIDDIFARSFEDAAQRAKEAGKPMPSTFTY